MATAVTVGDMTLTALNDGVVRLPPLFYPGLDFAAHPQLLADDSTYHIPVGCFLIQGNGFNVLVDAGLGPNKIPFPPDIAAAAKLSDPPEFIAEGGLLPEALADLGVRPGEIDVVVLTHLHADHIGWVAPGGEIFFADAEFVLGDAELQPPADPAPGELEGRAGVELVRRAGRARTLTEPIGQLAPGVVARHTPGHTPGHYVVSAGAAGDRAFLLGDVVHHPLQIVDDRISFVSELTPQDARATRERLFDEFAEQNVAIGMTHFPGLHFQRIVGAGPRRWARA